MLSLLCIEYDHWKIISTTHTQTHTRTHTPQTQMYEHKHMLLKSLLHWYHLRKGWVYNVKSLQNKNLISKILSHRIVLLNFPFASYLLFSFCCFASLWGGLMWAPDVEVDLLETDCSGFPPMPQSSHLKLVIPDIFVFCWYFQLLRRWLTVKTTSVYKGTNLFKRQVWYSR